MKLKDILLDILKKVNKISEKRSYNRYIKLHSMEKIFSLFLFHQYSGMKYGRSLTLQMQGFCSDSICSPSQGELSKKLSYRLPVEIWKRIYLDLLFQVKTLTNKKIKKVLDMIKIVDSSHLSATPSMTWAKHRKKKNGFKLHMMSDNNNIPHAFRLKNGNSSDKKSLKWAIKPGNIYVFDKGYNDYTTFSWIVEQEASFVTRACSNIHFKTIRNRKIGKHQKEYGILSDKIIQVITDRKSGDTQQFRMVIFEFIDSKDEYQKFSLLTDMTDIRSDQIAEIYKERWNIEVLFYWIKTFLKVKHWMSRSKNGILIQLYSALIAYLLVFIARMKNILNYKIMRDYVHEYSGILLKFISQFKDSYKSVKILLFSG